MLIPPPQRKCDQYWPAEGQQEYGGFLVTVKSSRALAFYTQRTFAVRNVRAKKVGAADQSHRRWLSDPAECVRPVRHFNHDRISLTDIRKI